MTHIIADHWFELWAYEKVTNDESDDIHGDIVNQICMEIKSTMQYLGVKYPDYRGGYMRE